MNLKSSSVLMTAKDRLTPSGETVARTWWDQGVLRGAELSISI
jgi:hypothetical protein